ncbi:MAG TPA: efflux RND transporter periplasmic adaptor subunit [Candidatus Binataceae bacterium]|nr:efflux RND transporter periplasmic adaptor subunit [Candidatus Binataceae bacterium]
MSSRFVWRWGWLIAIFAIGGGLLWFEHAPALVHYVTVRAERGTLTRAVTATGTVNPVVTVQVGTYVSGPIVKISCDFNTQVKKGQICAKIDPRPYELTVEQARASLANAQAQLKKDQATLVYDRLEYSRNSALLKENVVSQDTVDSAKSTADQAAAQIELDRASIQQQEASLHAAEVNLGFTNIISPVDGTVVLRNVDVGQTVAASFQTPTLFLIAQDLTRMQVDASVSESDVGPVRVGQRAEFTVDAFPHHPFSATVSQVRQAPVTVQNVVTYDVVLSVSNPELLLKPGMTANARIITAERKNVLQVPLQALRFSPNGADKDEDSAHRYSDHTARLWVLDGKALRQIQVVRGVDDGSAVEILSGNLKAGEQVVVDESTVPATGRRPRLARPQMGMHHL